jgi:SAM-dependent methyltransferase
VLLHDILGLDEKQNLFLAEECFEDLITLPITSELIDSGINATGCIEIDDLGAAFHISQPKDFWLLLTEKYSQETVLSDFFQSEHPQVSKRVKSSEEHFLHAVIEYYAVSLSQELLCEKCDIKGEIIYVEDRINRLQSLLKPIIPLGAAILEICCGNGIATQALLKLGHKPWCVDHDRCDVCQALGCNYLDPCRSFVLDARLLDKFFSKASFDVVLGFMVGLIDQANWPAWRDILLTSSRLSKRIVLFTVYTQREAELIEKALSQEGWKGKVIDNRDAKGIYDQWVYLGAMWDEKVISTSAWDLKR